MRESPSKLGSVGNYATYKLVPKENNITQVSGISEKDDLQYTFFLPDFYIYCLIMLKSYSN